MQQLVSILRDRRSEDRPALIFEGESLSYRQVWESVLGVGDCLSREGVWANSKVVVALANSPALPIVMMALSEIGAVSIPLNPSMAEKERTRIVGIAQPDFVACFQGQKRLVPGVSVSRVSSRSGQPDPALEGVSTIVFTSGTTGNQKGVLLSADALLINAESVVEYLELGPDDRTLIFLPLHYSYALSQLLTTWMGGGAVVLMKHLLYPAQAMKLIDQHGVTGVGGVPTSLSILAAQSTGPKRSPRYVMSAGAPLPPMLVRKLNAVFPGAAIFNNYGCTEIGPRATAVNYAEHPDRIGSIGRPIARVGVKLIHADQSEAEPRETAEIVLSGPTLMKGYYRDPNSTASRMSRWGFHTGDYAYADEDGFLYYQGRADDIFKSGGEKVSAREIEDVILEHNGVLEVAVVAETHPVLGHVSVAYVVRVEAGGPTEEGLRLFCRRKLSSHKVPRIVRFMDKLERTANGKVQKFRLKAATL